MSKHKLTPSEGLATVAEDIQTLVTATSDNLGEKIDAARQRLSVALENGEEMFDQARKSAARSAKKADKYVRENPYQSLAIAFGFSALTAWILSHRNRD
jgi:ElaB/YqjD/DUF883 family membrane-anchored ribosome-binding protein